MEAKIKILIADDHPIFRKGLLSVFLNEKNIQIVAEASDGEQALELIKKYLPDVAILDIEMPKLTGFEAAQILFNEKINVKVIFLTAYRDEHLFNKALDLGVKGYVLKENAVIDILNCVEAVEQDKYFISPLISEYLINRKNKEISRSLKVDLSSLTPSEKKLLLLIADGKSNKELANELFNSIKTIENHRSNICKKLNLSGSHSLYKFALKNRSSLL
jgi:DNA-binding NarL/FixJ family response regulator